MDGTFCRGQVGPDAAVPVAGQGLTDLVSRNLIASKPYGDARTCRGKVRAVAAPMPRKRR